MLDINYIKENKEKVAEAARNKKVEVDLDQLLALDDQRRELIQKIQKLREERNTMSQANSSSAARVKGKQLKEDIREIEKQLQETEEALLVQMQAIPNMTHPDMPIGKDEDENVVIRSWGTPREFDFKVKDHVELGEALDLIDTSTAAQVSGPRFYYLKNAAVQLQFAIIQLVMSTLMNRDIVGKIAKEVGNKHDTPFTPILPPILMKSQIMKKMDRLDPIDDRFYFEKDDLVLVGSAEHSLGPYYMDQILQEKELPIRFIGYSTAFRREAGSYGRDTRGIIRVHQFDKLEMETYTTAEDGETEQALLVGLQEYLVQQLELPYQVIDVCSGDAGKPDYRQIDINTWVPSQEKYRETHSADYVTDFQSRRLNIRYKTASGDKQFVFMNDATAIAIPRILVALMENNQQKDGSIRVPKALQSLVGFDTIKAL